MPGADSRWRRWILRLRRIALHRATRRFAAAGLLASVGALLALLLWPMDTARYLRIHSSGEIQDRHGRLLAAFLNPDQQWCFERELDAISPHLVQATLAAEDQRFWWHPGVDPCAVLRAGVQNAFHLRTVSGASTLTMQAVKLVDHPPRSLEGKLAQVGQAVRLECRISKRQILQTYLNSAPYGLNLVGCEAASRRYFGKPASELTLSEAALLAALPKAPANLMPLAHAKEARSRRNHVLRRMAGEGFISLKECERACAAPIGAGWHEFPALAKHAAMRMRSQVAQGGQIETLMDGGIQQSVERLVQRAINQHDGEITNAAVMVVDVASGAILSSVGSADFFHTPGGGQVDATRAPRSPGSTLKPFVYALAMERHCLFSSEVLCDGQLDYGLYSPENYDSQHRGLISATYALRRSLNVPAVLVLDRVGVANAHELLHQAGLNTLRDSPDHYGLGLSLGNCEARLDQLVKAYLMLANLGETRSLRLLPQEPAPPPHRLLSRGVCLALYEMMEQPLPDEWSRDLVQATRIPPRVCWKTGTSTGHRDAWAFVFNAQYLVGVWMGNNDASPSRRLVGSQAALPLASAVFRSLPPKPSPAWPETGDDLREVTICAVSGLPASEWCTSTRTVLLPRCQYLHRRCDVHGPAPHDRAGGPRIIERWPGAAKGWDLADIKSPVWSCGAEPAASAARARALRILTPPDQAEFVLTGEEKGDAILLRTSLDAAECLHWFLDDRYLGASSPERPLQLALAPGPHKLTCMVDQKTSTDTVQFEVVGPRSGVRFKQ